MTTTGSIGFGATSPWIQLEQGTVNMALVPYVEFSGQGAQLRATLVFSVSKSVPVPLQPAANQQGQIDALILEGSDARAVQKWVYDHRHIPVK